MKIEAQFDSIEEMMGFAIKLVGGTTAAEAIRVSKVKNVKEERTPSEDEKSVKDPVGVEEPETVPEEEPDQEEPKSYTLEEVRAAMAVLTRKGKAKEVKGLLEFFGAKNLSGVDPKDYAALMEKAGVI